MTSSVGEIVRHEKAILKSEWTLIDSGYGGTLTLTEHRLTWKASRWRLLQLISQKGIRAWGGSGGHAPPKLLEINLRQAKFAVGSPLRPWVAFILFPPMILLELVSGGSRKTLEVDTPHAVPYYFAVKDAAGWLDDIGRARGDG